MQSSRLEISRAALLHNLSVLRSAAEGRELLPVVKADSYGLGLRAVLSILTASPNPPQTLCVATLAEVYDLRQLGWQKGILMLGAHTPSDIREILAFGARPWVMSIPTLHELLRHNPARLDINFDLGMGRMGIHPDAIEAVRDSLRSYRGTLGIGVHHPNADSSELSSARAMAQRWQIFATGLGHTVTEQHSANTAATLNGLAVTADSHVRCGIGLYGVDPRPGAADGILHSAVRLQGRIAEYRHVRAGDGLSYGHEFVAPRDMVIAVVTAGYADGLPIAGASQVPVYIGDFPTHIVGRVTMDTVLIDATELAESQRQQWATLLGGPNSEVHHWAKASGRSPYEILTGLGARPHRVVVT